MAAMRHATWVRGTVALVVWTVVTAVATIGSWLGLSAVFVDSADSDPATVVTSTDDVPVLPETDPSSPPLREPQSAEQQPQHTPPVDSTGDDGDTGDTTGDDGGTGDDSSTQPAPSTPFEDEPHDGDAWQDWTAIGNGIYERTFITEGGTATVQLYQEQVALLSASPAEGYTAAADTTYPDRMFIAFFSEVEAITIDVGWWQDEPYAEVGTM